MKKMDIVCGIIKLDNKYLIAKRGKGIHENIWEFPGGKVERHERKEEALVREIKEELELDINIKEFLCDILDEREDVMLHVHAYLCEYLSGSIKLHVHHEVQLVDVCELFHYQFEEADKPILLKLKMRERL